MAITENQLLADLKAQKFKPVYLITGEENYYIDLVTQYFEDYVVEEENRDFDQVVLYGRDVEMRDVIVQAKQYPMLSPRRLVLVKEAQDIPTRGEAWDMLTNYLQSPTDTTVLVLCYRDKKLDKRTKAYKAISEKGVVYEKAKMYDDRLPEWIGLYVRDKGYSITQRTAAMVAQCIGNDLCKIANELSKIFINIEPGSVIDETAVERYVGISKSYNTFELINAIGRRDVVQCNRIINNFAANSKETPIQKLLPNIYSFILKVMMYHQLENKADAARVLGISNFYVKDYELASRNYSLGKLASCIGYLQQADLRSKGVGGAANDGELLKELVFKIIH